MNIINVISWSKFHSFSRLMTTFNRVNHYIYYPIGVYIKIALKFVSKRPIDNNPALA